MRPGSSLRRIRVGVSLLLVLILLGGLAWGLRGRGLGSALHSNVRAVLSTIKAVLDRSSAKSTGNFTTLIFLHHSTGQNLIEQGGVREAFAAAGYSFWDHSYNDQGLTRPDGMPAGYSYNIPDDNTDPDGLARIFSQRRYSWPLNAFSGLMRHEVIIFKSCFPVSNITSDVQLEQYRAYYLQIREVIDRYPNRIFVVVTPPPLNPAETDAEAAARARAFAEWLKSDEFLGGHPNVLTVDLFDLLAEGDVLASDLNMLRAAYRDGKDSHPNRLANQTIGPLLVNFVLDAVEVYRAGLAEGGETP